MKYDDPTLRQQLAGAYALGSLQGAARARFERLMEDDVELRRLVVEYQEELSPLALAAPEVQPPAWIRQRLAQATTPSTETDTKPNWWHRLSFWRALATANGLFAVALVAFVGIGMLRQQSPVMSELVYVGVLSDPQQKPGVAVLAYNHPFRLEIAAKTALHSQPGSQLRLWIRERDNDSLLFLAAIPPNEKVFMLDDQTWKLLRQAKALMITREKTGSATTTPGQDVLYSGICINLKTWSDSGDSILIP
ncbi:MAG: anti-sigma factor [Gammaproteobacteria bacterium]|nr:anti-sigma factor [Gammaproteobacteria bacterium]